jgi:hypothetical protein
MAKPIGSRIWRVTLYLSVKNRKSFGKFFFYKTFAVNADRYHYPFSGIAPQSI